MVANIRYFSLCPAHLVPFVTQNGIKGIQIAFAIILIAENFVTLYRIVRICAQMEKTDMGNMAKKTIKKEETLNLDNILFKCRDILRQAKNSGSFFEKRDMMLTLVFLRFIGEKYEDGVA